MNKYIVNGLIKATEVHSAMQCNDLTRAAMQWLRGYWERIIECETFEEGLELLPIGLMAESMIRQLSETYPDYVDTLKACYDAISKYRTELPAAKLTE